MCSHMFVSNGTNQINKRYVNSANWKPILCEGELGQGINQTSDLQQDPHNITINC